MRRTARIALSSLLLIVSTFVFSNVHAGGITIPLEDGQPPNCWQTDTVFYAHKPGPINSLQRRDLEFQWSRAYAVARGDHGLSADEKTTLNNLGKTISETHNNVFGASMSDLELVYNYLNSTDTTYSTDPLQSIGFSFGYSSDGLGSIPGIERGHLDFYLYAPSECGVDFSQYPSSFRSSKEDSSSNAAAPCTLFACVRPWNSISTQGPALGAPSLDLTGNGWTQNGASQAVLGMHEFQHGMPGPNGNPNELPFGAITEFFSMAAQVLVGDNGLNRFEDVPFTQSLLSNIKFGTICGDLSPTCVRAAGRVYNYWQLFAAYLMFNFRGADTTPTLPGFQDDLLYEWAHSGRYLGDLRALLQDQTCWDCSQKSYFTALSDTSRLALLLHNWRVANYVNNSSLAEGQYGYPAMFDFDPRRDVGLWRGLDPSIANDLITIPPEVQIRYAPGLNVVRLSDTRSGPAGSSYPMTFQRLGSEYWVIRCDPADFGTARTLHVRVFPEGKCDARLVASIVGYSPPSDDSVLVADLSLHPQWATVAGTPQWEDVADIRGPLDLTLPNFGTACKAALVVLSLADGPAQSQSAVSNVNPLYEEIIPYRLTIGYEGNPFHPPQPPSALVANSLFADRQATWSPASDEVIYNQRALSSSKLFRKLLDGTPPTLVASDALPQFAPDWSPRGDWIAFEKARTTTPGAPTDIWVFNLLTSASLQITSGPTAVQPVFSPSGQEVAYLQPAIDPVQIRRVNLDGSGDTLLCAIPHSIADPTNLRWSANGDSIFYAKGDSLYAVSADVGPPTKKQTGSDATVGFDISLGAQPWPIVGRWKTFFCHSDSANLTRIVSLDRRVGITEPAVSMYSNLDEPALSSDGTKLVFSLMSTSQNATRDLWQVGTTSNHAPTMTVLDTVISQGQPFSLTLHAMDADNDLISYVAPPRYLPSGSSLSDSVFTWSDPQPANLDYYVVFRALDPYGGVANRVVKIRVVGGGGCPFVETKTQRGWEVENSILGRSSQGELSEDRYRLKNEPVIASNRIQLQIRENEREITTLDQVKLVAVDHETGTRVFTQGSRLSIGTIQAPYRIQTGRGRDITQQASGGSYYEGQPGETLYVDMVAPRGGGASAGRPVVEDEDEGGGVLNGFQKDPGEENLRQHLPGGIAAQSADARVLEGTGIVVQVPDGQDGWRDVKHYYPREYADDCVIDSVGTRQMRLIFVGRHRLTLVGRLVGTTEAQHVTELELVTARHSRLGSVVSPVSTSGQSTIELTTGDTLSLEFGAIPPSEGMVRDYFLVTTGVYTTATPASQRPISMESLPKVFALSQNRPNPFARETEIVFALPVPASVKLEIFDLAGRRISLLADRSFPAGFHKVTWNRSNVLGSQVAPGVYLYRISAGAFVEQRKMVLLPR